MHSSTALLVTLVVGLVAGAALGLMFGSSDRPAPELGSTHAVEHSRSISGSDSDDRSAELAAPAAQELDGSSVEESVNASQRRIARRAARAAAARVSIEADESTGGTATITGLVTDEFGTPIVRATILSNGVRGTAVRRAPRDSRSVGRGWDGFEDLESMLEEDARATLSRRAKKKFAVADDEGRFEIEGLAEGIHGIQCYAEGFTFPFAKAQTGASITLIGKRVGTFEIQPVLPHGETPTTATVAVVDADERQTLYNWTREEPVVRLPERIARLQVLQGDLVEVYYMTYAAEFASDVRVVDLDRDGDGPHEFELAPFTHLRITVRDTSSAAPPIEPWVKLSPSGSDDFETLRNNGDGPVVANGLAPGRYDIHVGRGSGDPEVEHVVDLTPGKNEIEIELPEVNPARFIVATCVDQEGRALSDLEFYYQGHRENGSRSGGIRPLARPGGEYWISVDDLRYGDEEFVSIDLKVTSPTHGTLERVVDMESKRVHFEFREACHLTVEVIRNDPVAVRVDVGYDEPTSVQPIYGRDVIELGVSEAMGTALVQPRDAYIAVRLTGDDRWGGEPVIEERVQLAPGERRVSLTVPPLHQVVVLVPNSKTGTRVRLFRVSDDGQYKNVTSAQTDENARARLTDVVPGPYMLQVETDDSLGQMYIDVPTSEVRFEAFDVNGYRVSKVEEGTVGDRIGLRVGDVLTKINGHPVDGYQWGERLMLELSDGPAQLGFIRSGRTMSVEVPKFEKQVRMWKDWGVRSTAVHVD